MDWSVYAYGPVTLASPQYTGLPRLQSTGHDLHARVIANSLFVSPATQDYRIKHDLLSSLWLNGVKTMDYAEPDATIRQAGVFGLQIH
jgi:hypothetical protein